jgi:ribosomal protein S18 acetylase RimI-like enzyme
MKIVELVEPDKKELAQIRKLFNEYVADLGVNLDFQDFKSELKQLPGKYAPPTGALFVVKDNNDYCGCVALKALSEDICELKRLYVRPQFRGESLGRKLIKIALNKAAQLDYQFIRLDTLKSLVPAIKLYHDLGFYEISSYNGNPLPGAIFLEKELKEAVFDDR